MTKPPVDTSFTTDVAQFYESTLVPLIFQPYARDLAARTASVNPNAVLEVACGTGVVTRELAKVLPESSSIVATDLNEAMVLHGQTVGTARAVTWRQADVMALPFEAGTFDAVVCQFATMFFPDRAAAYREVRRVLRPGGRFLFNVWKDIEQNEFADTVTKAVGELFPHDPPVFLARTPHGHGSPEEIATVLGAAGFPEFELVERDEWSFADSPEIPAIAYCHGTPLRNEIVARGPDGLDRATEAATEAVRANFGSGTVEGRISAVVVVADRA